MKLAPSALPLPSSVGPHPGQEVWAVVVSIKKSERNRETPIGIFSFEISPVFLFKAVHKRVFLGSYPDRFYFWQKMSMIAVPLPHHFRK